MRIESGQVAVITGGASGIGYSLATALGHRGLRLVSADIRDSGIAAAAAALRSEGFDVTPVRTDVSNAESVQQLADTSMRVYGRVDLVCNNAGIIGPEQPMWEQDLDTWQRMIGVKFMGVVHGVRSFAPLLIKQGRGHMLNTASLGGLSPLPYFTPYNGTMHAVVGMTETLNLELKQISPDLGATVLCPGLVATQLGANSAALGAVTYSTSDDQPKTMEEAAARYGGILTPDQVAQATLEGIEADRVHVIIGATIQSAVRARVEAVLNDLA
jgi:NAD(P)-dependent dehydrogenase (short-subunit alcohol dehydrogenase family)